MFYIQIFFCITYAGDEPLGCTTYAKYTSTFLDLTKCYSFTKGYRHPAITGGGAFQTEIKPREKDDCAFSISPSHGEECAALSAFKAGPIQVEA